VLTEGLWQVLILKVLLNFLQEVVRSENLLNIWVLVVSLISGILVVEFFSAYRSPFFNSYKLFIEDFFGINLDKSSVSIIRNTTSVVAFRDQILNRLPWHFTIFLV
jgi:hypothetical protein